MNIRHNIFNIYSRSPRLNQKPSFFFTCFAILVSLLLGILPAYISKTEYLLVVSFLLFIFALLSIYRYDFLLLLCPLIFLFAQFQLVIFDLARWILLLILGFISSYIIRDEKFTINPVALSLGAIGIYSALTSAFSYYPIISLLKSGSLLLISLFITFVPLAIRRMHPHIGASRYIYNIYLWVGVLLVLSNAMFYLLFPSASFLGGRFRGWFINPNGIGAVYGIFILPVLAYVVLQSKKSRLRLGIFFVFLLSLLELFASQSRAGITAGFIALLVLILGKLKLAPRVLVLITIVYTVLAIYFINPENNLVRRFVYRNEVVFTGSDRFPVWSRIWNNFLSNPIIGSGLGVSNTGLDTQGFAFETSGYTIEKANSFLGVLEELGVIGACLLIITILPLLMKSFKETQTVSSNGYPITIVFAAIVFAGTFNSMFEAWLLSVGSFLCFSFWIFSSLLFISQKQH